MKVIAFNGSARKDGNTATLINLVLDELQKEGIDTELFQLAGKKIRGCKACFKCFEKKDKECIQKKDVLNECLDKMLGAEGIILGSPSYFGNVSTAMKALIERTGLVSIANDYMLKRKVGVPVVAVRRAGSVNVYNSINGLFALSQIIIPGSSYWNIGFGLNPGEVSKDDEGVQTMKTLGENMAWLLKKLH
jgi:multimeric flavodoxin WrbA